MVSDQKQRQQALDITKSFIVQAPAGSGKTEILTQRYLKLLSKSKNPESVLALTFTNKAVNELKERIIKSLLIKQVPSSEHKKLTFKLAQKVLQQNEKYGWGILNNHYRINVLTIDGLASKINENYPQEENFASKNILEGFMASDFYINAVKQTLLQIDKESSVKELLIHLDNDSANFIKLVAKMLEYRDKWITKIFDTRQINLTTIKQCIINIQQEYLTKINKLAISNLSVNFYHLCSLSKNLNQLHSIPNNIPEWIVLKEHLLTKKGKVRKNIAKFDNLYKNEKQSIQQIANNFSSDFIILLNNSSILPNTKINEVLMANIAKVLMLANIELQTLFNQYNKTDFIQIMLNANDALNTDNKVSNISLTLDYQIEHILLDEFQDTSYTQLDLIKKIVVNWEVANGRTLFLVGDPMQSIYLFRGAQVGVFLQTKIKGIAHIKLDNLTLTQNFRSTKSIVDANNKVFQAIFPDNDDVDNGAISFSHSTSANNNQSTALSICPFIGKQEIMEAKQIVSIVRKNNKKKIAILCVSRSHTTEISHLFNQENIEFEAIKNTKLIDNIFTMDLLNIIKVLLNPEDKLAWLCILRSPRCGIKLNDILKLSNGSIWYNLNHYQSLNIEETVRIEKILISFKNGFDNLGSFSLINILISITKNLNFPTTINQIEQIIFDKFIQIINKCEQTNQLEINIIEKYLNDLYAPTIKNNIKIMTIHQSKGLEFDIVIIPAIGKATKPASKQLIYLDEFKNNNILLATKPSVNANINYEYLHHIKKIRKHYEKIRLLYVAMTRAKEQVHLLGAVNDQCMPKKGSFLELLWQQYSYLWQSIGKTAITIKQSSPTMWSRYDCKNIVKIENILRPEKAQTISHTVINASIIGTIVHKFLQLEIFNITKNIIKNQLLTYGISPNKLNDTIQVIQTMLANTKTSKDFNFIFKNRTSTLVEVEFFYAGQTIIIDRLFIEKNIVWIIDFKTQSSINLSEADFIEQQKITHLKQLTLYKNILKNIYSKEIKTAIFLTNIGRMVTL